MDKYDDVKVDCRNCGGLVSIGDTCCSLCSMCWNIYLDPSTIGYGNTCKYCIARKCLVCGSFDNKLVKNKTGPDTELCNNCFPKCQLCKKINLVSEKFMIVCTNPECKDSNQLIICTKCSHECYVCNKCENETYVKSV